MNTIDQILTPERRRELDAIFKDYKPWMTTKGCIHDLKENIEKLDQSELKQLQKHLYEILSEIQTRIIEEF